MKEIQDELDNVAQHTYGLSYEEYHSWDAGGWWRGLISLVDDCHSIFKDILLNADIPGGKLFVPVGEVWYDISDGEVMDSGLARCILLRLPYSYHSPSPLLNRTPIG